MDERGSRTDEVDLIIAAWHRERPDLDLTPLEVLSRIARISHVLDRTRRAAFHRHDLEPWEFDVLAALRRSGPPHTLSPGSLIAATGVTSGTMTNRLDRLDARGLVARQRGAHDGRAVDVMLTADGGRVADTALADLVAAEARLLAGLPEDEREDLARLLKELIRTLP